MPIDPNTSLEFLAEDGARIAHTFLAKAVDAIDAAFDDKGYAAKHPEVTTAFLRAASLNFQTLVLAQQFVDAIAGATNALNDLVTTINEK